MATVISVGRLTDQFESNRDDKPNGTDHPDKQERGPSALLEQTAGGAMEMATLLNDPGMKRSESSEILHLTLHQVSYDAVQPCVTCVGVSICNVGPIFSVLHVYTVLIIARHINQSTSTDKSLRKKSAYSLFKLLNILVCRA